MCKFVQAIAPYALKECIEWLIVDRRHNVWPHLVDRLAQQHATLQRGEEANAGRYLVAGH